MYPTNEKETIELYKLAQDKLGWHIVHLQGPFPDAIIENASGKQLVAEFEHKARNFKQHGHDPAGSDIIICWTNNWHDAPLPVWALDPSKGKAWYKRQNSDFIDVMVEQGKEIEYLKARLAAIEQLAGSIAGLAGDKRLSRALSRDVSGRGPSLATESIADVTRRFWKTKSLRPQAQDLGVSMLELEKVFVAGWELGLLGENRSNKR